MKQATQHFLELWFSGKTDGSAQNVGGKLKSTTNHWLQPNEGATNESEFTALPGGSRVYNYEPGDSTSFGGMGYGGLWWSSTANDANSALYRMIQYDFAGIYRQSFNKKEGYCARCLQD